MKKLGYKNTYHRLVTKANLDKIKDILNECEYYDKNTVEQIEYEGKNNLPYFILIVDLAQYIGRRGAYATLNRTASRKGPDHPIPPFLDTGPNSGLFSKIHTN